MIVINFISLLFRLYFSIRHSQTIHYFTSTAMFIVLRSVKLILLTNTMTMMMMPTILNTARDSDDWHTASTTVARPSD